MDRLSSHVNLPISSPRVWNSYSCCLYSHMSKSSRELNDDYILVPLSASEVLGTVLRALHAYFYISSILFYIPIFQMRRGEAKSFIQGHSEE